MWRALGMALRMVADNSAAWVFGQLKLNCSGRMSSVPRVPAGKVFPTGSLPNSESAVLSALSVAVSYTHLTLPTILRV